jgi:metallo-beta-lactamase class B
MKRTLTVTLLAMAMLAMQTNIAAAQQRNAGAPQVPDRQAEDKPAPPFKIFDNIWFDGFESATSFVFKTSAGLILIDTGYKNLEDYQPKAFQQLGLNPRDVKYIIINHAHTDHTGGANYMQKLTGSRVGMAEGDWEFQSKGTYMNSQGYKREFTPIKKDLVIKDGDTLTLGDTTLKFHVLPGHTPGDTSFEFTAIEGGKKYKGFYFSGMGTDFKGVKAAQEHLAKVKAIASLTDIQVSLTDHVQGGKILEKGKQLASRKPGDPNPFVDPAIFKEQTQRLLASAEKKLKEEQAAGRP